MLRASMLGNGMGGEPHVQKSRRHQLHNDQHQEHEADQRREPLIADHPRLFVLRLVLLVPRPGCLSRKPVARRTCVHDAPSIGYALISCRRNSTKLPTTETVIHTSATSKAAV